MTLRHSIIPPGSWPRATWGQIWPLPLLGLPMTEAAKLIIAERERLPNRRAHTLLNIEAGGFRYVAGVGHYDDGRLAEIFLSAEKGGTAIDDAARDSAVVASLALQHGVDPDTCGTLSCATAAVRQAARWACCSTRSATALIARRGGSGRKHWQKINATTRQEVTMADFTVPLATNLTLARRR